MPPFFLVYNVGNDNHCGTDMTESTKKRVKIGGKGFAVAGIGQLQPNTEYDLPAHIAHDCVVRMRSAVYCEATKAEAPKAEAPKAAPKKKAPKKKGADK